MRRIIKIGFPILCVAVIGGTFILLNKATERISRNNLKEEDAYTNTVENNIEEDEVVENKTTNEVIDNNKDIIATQEAAKTQEIENRAKAIELVKQYAPPTTNCYYTNEGMTGEYYLVAIRENDTNIVKIYYSVDVVSGKIQIYTK